MPEITLTQVQGGKGQTSLPKALPKSYATYRTIRSDPTIAMARALSMAPVVSAEWGVEGDDEIDDEQIKLIKDMYFPIREPFLMDAMSGGIDFGWAGFEQVFELIEGTFTLMKLKNLLVDLTDILVDPNTGVFMGYKQDQVVLSAENALHIGFRVEGTKWTGEALLEYARNPYNRYLEADDGARRYDLKVAGSHFIVYYPYGESVVDGETKDNSEVAETILKNLESSGGATIPRVVAEHVEDLNEEALGWKIEIISDSTARQYSFTNRLEYLDKRMVRALLIPERAIIEGKFGTKADAGQHADLALTHMELTHSHITRMLNWHSVNRVLAQNFGPEAENTIRLTTAPLSEDKRAFFREVYMQLLRDPIGFAREFELLDTDALKDTLGIPASKEVASSDIDPNDPRAATARDIFEDIPRGADDSDTDG